MTLAQASKILTAIGYIAYPLLLVLLAIFDRQMLLRCIVVPAIGFVGVSIFRNIVNAPRPYEVNDTAPLIPKNTRGHSFPSRHTFSMFTIACTWMLYQPIVGTALLVLACAMAVIRVVGGVHFPRDVIVGAISAIVVCAAGYLLIPW
ncbi:phosphatase PAP2 family protein [Adlercreutzia sp. ZJ304]|uniref:phosphatase PAP2 family protein n=1 Tax=Adlercreutzia sp. ZJ304 TaxID=2709791 RepID=UPI0013EB85C0|nr:phosphatase PAP2 family protein [Adlercreutzia sp. ZJ304]